RVLFHTLRIPSSTTLFPYTTLFRSRLVGHAPKIRKSSHIAALLIKYHALSAHYFPSSGCTYSPFVLIYNASSPSVSFTAAIPSRSEEHTSELQSRENLVCRLLLEKK